MSDAMKRSMLRAGFTTALSPKVDTAKMGMTVSMTVAPKKTWCETSKFHAVDVRTESMMNEMRD